MLAAVPRLALYALDVRQQLYDHVAPLCVTSSSSFLFALFVPARAQLIVKLITARPFHAVRSLIERRFPPTKIDLDGNGDPDFVVPASPFFYYGKGLLGPFVLFLLEQVFFAALFCQTLGWHFSVAFYHCMVTATTVGYGDTKLTTYDSRWLATFHILASVSGLAALLSDFDVLREQRRHEVRRAQQFLGRLNVDMIMSLDHDGKGVDRFEFVIGMLTRLNYVSVDDVAGFIAQFDALDESGDGNITRAELEKYAKQQQSLASQNSAYVSQMRKNCSAKPSAKEEEESKHAQERYARTGSPSAAADGSGSSRTSPPSCRSAPAGDQGEQAIAGADIEQACAASPCAAAATVATQPSADAMADAVQRTPLQSSRAAAAATGAGMTDKELSAFGKDLISGSVEHCTPVPSSKHRKRETEEEGTGPALTALLKRAVEFKYITQAEHDRILARISAIAAAPDGPLEAMASRAHKPSTVLAQTIPQGGLAGSATVSASADSRTPDSALARRIEAYTERDAAWGANEASASRSAAVGGPRLEALRSHYGTPKPSAHAGKPMYTTHNLTGPSGIPPKRSKAPASSTDVREVSWTTEVAQAAADGARSAAADDVPPSPSASSMRM